MSVKGEEKMPGFRGEEIFLEAMKEIRFVFSKDDSPKDNNMQKETIKSETREIDLHGYTVEKALVKLEEMLTWKTQNPKTKLAFIVGKGKHSAFLTPFLRKAFEQVLEEKKISYVYDNGVIYL